MTDALPAARAQGASRLRSLGLASSLALVLAAGALGAGGMEIWLGMKAEKVSDLVRPEMTDEGLAQHRHDFESAKGTVNGIQDDLVPAVAESLGVSPASLQRDIETDYPAVGRFLAEKDAITAFAGGIIDNLEVAQDQFQSADDSPVSWLPQWAGGALSMVLAAGVVVAVATSPGRNRPLTAGLALAGAGTVLVAFALVCMVPRKAADAQAVLDTLKPAPAIVDRTEESFSTARAAAEELDQQLLPDIARELGTDRAGLDRAIAAQFPDLATGVEELPRVLDRYEDRVAIRTNGAPNLRTLKRFPIRELGWFDPAYGALMAAVGITVVVIERRRAAKRA
jgi:hypothetical protein